MDSNRIKVAAKEETEQDRLSRIVESRCISRRVADGWILLFIQRTSLSKLMASEQTELNDINSQYSKLIKYKIEAIQASDYHYKIKTSFWRISTNSKLNDNSLKKRWYESYIIQKF